MLIYIILIREKEIHWPFEAPSRESFLVINSAFLENICFSIWSFQPQKRQLNFAILALYLASKKICETAKVPLQTNNTPPPEKQQ